MLAPGTMKYRGKIKETQTQHIARSTIRSCAYTRTHSHSHVIAQIVNTMRASSPSSYAQVRVYVCMRHRLFNCAIVVVFFSGCFVLFQVAKRARRSVVFKSYGFRSVFIWKLKYQHSVYARSSGNFSYFYNNICLRSSLLNTFVNSSIFK